MKNLTATLKRHGWTQRRLARTLDVAPSTINRICARKEHPSLALAIEIEFVTGGKLALEDLPLSLPNRRAVRRLAERGRR